MEEFQPHTFTYLFHIRTFDECHEKTDLKVFVVVIPKEGWVLGCAHPSFWYDTDFSEFDSADIITNNYILEKSTTTKTLRSVFS